MTSLEQLAIAASHHSMKPSVGSVIRLSAASAASCATASTPTSSTSTAPSPQSRRCIFNCDTNSSALCRFPIHDQKRCNNWFNLFKIDAERIQTLGGLANLRVCFKHFHEKQQMAKTRIKTTPTRMQKDALMAASATKLVAEDAKKRLRQQSAICEKPSTTPSIIVSAPKRTNSISSATSSISQASDTHSAHSESPPPLLLNAANAQKTTLNNLLHKQPAAQIASLQGRKVYMITEKSENSKNSTSSTQNGQKRKMYLIMEENTAQNSTLAGDAQKLIKTENGTAAKASKKLTLYADRSAGELPQKFEQILPEILTRIQAKSAASKAQSCVEESKIKLKPQPEVNEIRLPITLPPKKNRTKIITSSSNISNGSDLVSNGIDSYYNNHITRETAAATPVIVTVASQLPKTPITNGQPAKHIMPQQQVPQKNINLSTDFLFLMKMLPKLESIQEPHKSHVKNCIEKIITQHASMLDD